MSNNDKPHQSPIHGTEESQPGMDSLAPADGSHKPSPGLSAPGEQPTAPGSMKSPDADNEKLKSLDPHRKGGEGYALTTNQGVRIADDQNSLRAGTRGPTLLEDFILREKITHFDHERIPERIVHARGSAAHGYFQPYKSLKEITKADFLSDPNKITPVFVRFSTVQGGAGSADTVRDIRGFATKFYTEEGIFDLVGNNTPVFFIQDAHKFPDFVHAVKPEPHWAIPQGQSAHDTFWDYVSLQPETLHNVMWAMSDRGIPRSYRTMEGFGIHTFRLINAEGKATFVRFHWKPVAGKASLVWDEAQKLTGRDPDFHRRELWESIEAGDFPEYELGLQLIPEEDEFKFDFDLLDPTKLIPEELVPVQLVGKMVLNRNPDNFFAENEQAAFHPGHIVPGLDFTNDPLLQGRLFSYTDTQISRLGGPNFHEIPINRPTCPYHNFQRDGMHRQDIDTNPANYEPNSINDNWPRETPPGPKRGGFESYQERVDGTKIRERSPSFGEYYAQPRLFWNSQTPIEQQHIIGGFSFELSKVVRTYIRERVVDHLAHIDIQLAQGVANNLGITLTDEQCHAAPPNDVNGLKKDPSLSLYAVPGGSIKGRVVAILLNDKPRASDVLGIMRALKTQGVHAKLLYSRMGEVTADDGSVLPIAATFAGAPSLTVDAVIMPCGDVESLLGNGDAAYYLLEAYKHLKPIALAGDARKFKTLLKVPDQGEEGIVEGDNVDDAFMTRLFDLLAAHRVWSRSSKIDQIPA
ncbi:MULTISPECIES: catalase HPII [Enterobacter cloacae complex]|uniref:catalase HPII n=1 Tax=Enterobacter cloacae complex TaxID=354276 RepID=UPI0005ED6F9F|nr:MULTISPECIES: catalase HPII [Enterobacter cloacae complex]EKV3690688.1 catalase HPII [Enterobacter hormaechei]EKV4584797.1 catalase HPII [Enterobacter hormaechei]KJP05936.1 hydroperoxidase [Enterobacter hormaechei subsp. xiangfangensis]MBF1936191.1 catalase HPII [Enterobacter hormaechei]MBF9207530.1 catalase HPII [Enterobacter hormaechei]